MLEEYNDNGSINVVATDKNLRALKDRDLALCIRNILVQRCLFGAEDLESFAHSAATVMLAREIIAKHVLNGKYALSRRVIRTVKHLRDGWDFEGRLELRP